MQIGVSMVGIESEFLIVVTKSKKLEGFLAVKKSQLVHASKMNK